MCIVPSSPIGFVNVSRTATSVSFSWNSPTDVNGVMQDYKVTIYCTTSCMQVHYMLWHYMLWHYMLCPFGRSVHLARLWTVAKCIFTLFATWLLWKTTRKSWMIYRKTNSLVLLLDLWWNALWYLQQSQGCCTLLTVTSWFWNSCTQTCAFGISEYLDL